MGMPTLALWANEKAKTLKLDQEIFQPEYWKKKYDIDSFETLNDFLRSMHEKKFIGYYSLDPNDIQNAMKNMVDCVQPVSREDVHPRIYFLIYDVKAHIICWEFGHSSLWTFEKCVSYDSEDEPDDFIPIAEEFENQCIELEKNGMKTHLCTPRDWQCVEFNDHVMEKNRLAELVLSNPSLLQYLLQ